MSGQEKLIEETHSRPDVVCAKCHHPNRRARTACEECGAHLYVVCHYCGHRNERPLAHCLECNHHLHRSLLKRAARHFRKGDKLSLVQMILLVAAILIGLSLIIFLADFRLPQPES